MHNFTSPNIPDPCEFCRSRPARATLAEALTSDRFAHNLGPHEQHSLRNGSNHYTLTGVATNIAAPTS